MKIIICILATFLFISCSDEPELYYKFVPQEDLTAIELYEILNADRMGAMNPPEGTERHFVIRLRD